MGLARRTLVAAVGDEQSPNRTIALAHGFTQNSRCWGPFASQLGASDRHVLAVDAPGHGESDHDDDDLHTAGSRVVEAGGHADWVGYSMGGRMLLHAALDSSTDHIRSLVLVGATGGIDDDAERRARRDRDEQLADRIEQIGTAAFIDEWLATPLFADLGDRALRDERLASRAHGLASSLRNCGTGTQLPLWDRLYAIDVPTLVIAGSADHKFTELGHRLVEAIGDNASFSTLPGGHALHLENPASTAELISSWLGGLEKRS